MLYNFDSQISEMGVKVYRKSTKLRNIPMDELIPEIYVNQLAPINKDSDQRYNSKEIKKLFFGTTDIKISDIAFDKENHEDSVIWKPMFFGDITKNYFFISKNKQGLNYFNIIYHDDYFFRQIYNKCLDMSLFEWFKSEDRKNYINFSKRCLNRIMYDLKALINHKVMKGEFDKRALKLKFFQKPRVEIIKDYIIINGTGLEVGNKMLLNFHSSSTTQDKSVKIYNGKVTIISNLKENYINQVFSSYPPFTRQNDFSDQNPDTLFWKYKKDKGLEKYMLNKIQNIYVNRDDQKIIFVA